MRNARDYVMRVRLGYVGVKIDNSNLTLHHYAYVSSTITGAILPVYLTVESELTACHFALVCSSLLVKYWQQRENWRQLANPPTDKTVSVML